jgi:ribosomal protein S17
VGDRVLIRETRPLSKKKRWRLVSILEGPEKVQAERNSA